MNIYSLLTQSNLENTMEPINNFEGAENEYISFKLKLNKLSFF